MVAQGGCVRPGWPVVLPVPYGVGDLGDGRGEQVVIHGSTGGRAFLDAAASPKGVRVCLCVSLNDALVVGRSLYDIGAHYRSVVAYGRARLVPVELRAAALEILVNHILPGRADEVRPHRAKELAATALLAIGLDQVSAKVARTSTGESADDGEDRTVWAGVVPLARRAGPPVAAPETVRPDDLPGSVQAFVERWAG
jgi:nitroimidazol reductase NimA-like FMN-containing flavoprotein (pyridoxamine 5'-phosphate oxidase superfamily)